MQRQKQGQRRRIPLKRLNKQNDNTVMKQLGRLKEIIDGIMSSLRKTINQTSPRTLTKIAITPIFIVLLVGIARAVYLFKPTIEKNVLDFILSSPEMRKKMIDDEQLFSQIVGDEKVQAKIKEIVDTQVKVAKKTLEEDMQKAVVKVDQTTNNSERKAMEKTLIEMNSLKQTLSALKPSMGIVSIWLVVLAFAVVAICTLLNKFSETHPMLTTVFSELSVFKMCGWITSAYRSTIDKQSSFTQPTSEFVSSQNIGSLSEFLKEGEMEKKHD